MSASALVITEIHEGIATVTLNRPDALNALNRELRNAVAEAFHNLRNNEDVRVAIFTGAGRAFCVGLDLNEIENRGLHLDEVGTDCVLKKSIEAFDRPVIGAINGFAITGGFELALMCDVLIVSSQAFFADTHARVGVVPSWGLTQRLAATIGVYRAKEVSLTGNYLSAQQACDWGLVNRVEEPEALLSTCQQLAQDMISCDLSTQKKIKHIIDGGHNDRLANGMQIESQAFCEHIAGLSWEEVGKRREGIQTRGRTHAVE